MLISRNYFTNRAVVCMKIKYYIHGWVPRLVYTSPTKLRRQVRVGRHWSRSNVRIVRNSGRKKRRDLFETYVDNNIRQTQRYVWSCALCKNKIGPARSLLSLRIRGVKSQFMHTAVTIGWRYCSWRRLARDGIIHTIYLWINSLTSNVKRGNSLFRSLCGRYNNPLSTCRTNNTERINKNIWKRARSYFNVVVGIIYTLYIYRIIILFLFLTLILFITRSIKQCLRRA